MITMLHNGNMGKEETVQLLSSTNSTVFQYSAATHDSDDGSVDENAPSQTNVLHVVENFRALWQPWESYCIVALIVCLFTMERICFKATVDLFSENVLGLWLISTFFAGGVHSMIWFLRKSVHLENGDLKFQDFPHSKCFFMSIFDSILLLGLLYSANVLSAVCTVLYFQMSTAGSVLFSKIVFPGRLYTTYHFVGTTLIIVVLLAVYLLDITLPSSTFLQDLLAAMFLVLSLLQGLSTIMKQKILIDWLAPIEISYFNMILSCYQFLTALIFTLLFSCIQEYLGKTASFEFFNWLLPSYMKVLALVTYIGASCALTYCLECGGICDTLLYRSMNIGIFTAFVFALLYDMQSLTWLSVTINVVALIPLLSALELYNYNPEPESELKILQQQIEQKDTSIV